MSMTASLNQSAQIEQKRELWTAEYFQKNVDALALSLGSRISASAILIASVIVILIGAQSLLTTLERMDKDIRTMSGELTVSNKGLERLNEIMDSVPPMSRHMSAIVATVGETNSEVKKSAQAITTLAQTTGSLDSRLNKISDSTTQMRSSHEEMALKTGGLASTINGLNDQIGPLVQTQADMYGQTQRMRNGLDGMNASLATTIRSLNYITAPPNGQDFQIKAELDKKSLPPIPGMKAEVAPISPFPRLTWPIYQGP